MTRRTGSANLPLHGGHVPSWLATRMAALGRVMAEAIVHHYGRDELLRRLAHPLWFQSLGAVMGMDWHSSGITTSVIGALQRGLAPIRHELGIYVCGGKGLRGRETPSQLTRLGDETGVDAAALTHASRLVAKVDGAALQDGFDLYLHAFIATPTGRWCVVQQGMNTDRREARRYHWLSEHLDSFLDSPHSAIDGRHQGVIVNLADARAADQIAPSPRCDACVTTPIRPSACFRSSMRNPTRRPSPRRYCRVCSCPLITTYAHRMWCCDACTQRLQLRPTADRAISASCC
jgi:hypothetical protein